MAAYHGEENFTSGPHRDTHFDTQILEPPVRITGERRGGGGAGAGRGGGEALSAGYYPPAASEASIGAPIPERSSGQTPMNSAFETQSKFTGDSNSGRMPTSLIITSLIFRAAAVVSLVVALAVLASMSYTLTDAVSFSFTYTFSFFSSTKYAMAAAIVGTAYSIYETVSVVVRLAMGHPLLPGNVSLVISYIGDQVVVVLLLTGASAAAATFKDLHDFPIGGVQSYCDVLGNFCKQGAGATAMIFLGFGFLAASLVISSLCFYKRKT